MNQEGFLNITLKQPYGVVAGIIRELQSSMIYLSCFLVC